jgi:lipopolysaccharide export system protein LptA
MFDKKAATGRPTIQPTAHVKTFVLTCGLAFGLMCALASSSLQAQTPPAPAAPAPAKGFGQSKLPTDITADHQELFNDENKSVYTGNVEVIQGQDRLRTPQLTIFFAKKDPNAAPKPKAAAAPAGAGSTMGKIERMEAEGPVYFADDTQNGRGDHGVYTAADQTTVLTGNVVLVQGKNVSTGDKLVLHQDTNQAQLYSGSSSKRVRGVFYNDDAKAPATPGAPPPPAKPKKPARP